MRFLSPMAFAFAAAIPVVVVFYLLKRKRVVKLVSSTLLWQKFLAETQASSPFQKLKHNWLLLLQILLLALVVFALARPFLAGTAKETPLRVMILDGSASMQSTDEKPNRFEKARAEALKWVDGLRDNEQMMILLAGATTQVKQSPTGDKAALRRALESCAPSDSPTRLAEALKTAGAFTFEKRGEAEVASGEIHLFSDGAAPDLEEAGNKNLPLIYHRIGQGGRNLGLVALDVKANPENPSQRAIFTAVANTFTNPITTDVHLLFDDQLLEVRSLTVAPTNTEPLVFIAPQNRDGIFTVRLTLEDDLAADNRASIVSRMPQPVKVALVTRGNRFLEKALRGPPNVELTVMPMLTDEAKAFDIAVLDDVVPVTWPAVNTLAIQVANTNWIERRDLIKNPAIVDWKSTHPLLRFVNFDNVQIAEAQAIKPPPWGIPLVESPQTPLVVAGEQDRRRLVWIAFDTLQSTWPLRISFPIFMANAVEWLNPASAESGALLVQAGKPFHLNLFEPVSSAKITAPDGRTQNLPIEAGTREIIFTDTSRQGTYRLQAGTNETLFCVNLLDPVESNIQPRQELPFGKYEKVQATTLKEANLELWRWIVAGGLMVLLFEWWFYHKRTV
jgi:Aerotolerance regulator N-terminal/von Willebrand factor type A domain